MSAFRREIRDLQHEHAVPEVFYQVLPADSDNQALEDEILVGKQYHRLRSHVQVHQPQGIPLAHHREDTRRTRRRHLR